MKPEEFPTSGSADVLTEVPEGLLGFHLDTPDHILPASAPPPEN